MKTTVSKAVTLCCTPEYRNTYIAESLADFEDVWEEVLPELDKTALKTVHFFITDWIEDRNEAVTLASSLFGGDVPDWLELSADRDRENIAIVCLLLGIEQVEDNTKLKLNLEEWSQYTGPRALRIYWKSYFYEMFQTEVYPGAIEPNYFLAESIVDREPNVKKIRKNIQIASEKLDYISLTDNAKVLTERILELEQFFEIFTSHLRPSEESLLGALDILASIQKAEHDKLRKDAQETYLKVKIDDLTEKLEQSQSNLHSFKNQLRGLEKSLSTKKNDLDQRLIPAINGSLSMQNILGVLQAIMPDDAVILDQSETLLASADYRHPYRVVDSIIRITRDYASALKNGIPDSDARHILGSRYRAVESESTINNKQCRAQRTFTYNGKEYLFQQHITLGSGRGTSECIQIHFGRIDNVTIIARIGPHLDTQ